MSTVAPTLQQRLSVPGVIGPRRDETCQALLIPPCLSLDQEPHLQLSLAPPDLLHRASGCQTTMVRSTTIFRVSDALPLAASVDDESVSRRGVILGRI